MTNWSEETLRKAAAWQAFKEGRDLEAGGAVVEVKSGSSGWQGSVRGGRRPFRVKVVVKSATDLMVHCSCPENQRSGAVCAHAVATGLAALGQGVVREPQLVEKTEVRTVAWEIRLPVGWKKAVQAGRLSATLKPQPESAPDEADRVLCDWLGGAGLSLNQPHALLLQGVQLGGFLQAIHEHARIGVDGATFTVRTGARLRLVDFERVEDHVVMRAEPGDGEWIQLGGVWWVAGDASLEMLGMGSVPDSRIIGELANGRSVRIKAIDFLRMANEWRDCMAFPERNWLDLLVMRHAPHRLMAELDGSERQLQARLRIRYDGLDPCPLGAEEMDGLPRLEEDVVWQRNLAAEAMAMRSWTAAGFVLADGSDSRWTLTGNQAVADFLTGMRPVMEGTWEISESSAVARLARQSALVAPRIEVRGTGEDWLSFSVEYRTDDGEILEPAEVRRLIQGGRVTSKRGKVCRMAGGKARAWQALLSDLDARQEQDSYVVDRRGGLVVEEAVRAFSQQARQIDDGEAFAIPSSFAGELRPYQRHGAAWLADRCGRFGGAVLADDMGLGKTVQTIAWVEGVFAQQPEACILVLATTSLLGNWRAEWGKFAPDRAVRVLHGADREETRKTLGGGEVWLTSHSTLVRDLAWYLRREFTAVVVDEASLLRNPDTDMAKAVRKLHAAAKVALTGTPVENHVTDLWSLFSWVQPGWLGSREEFRERFEKPSRSEGGERDLVLSHLRLKTAPFILRRTKDLVAPELPSKILIDEFCDLLPTQAKLYAEVAREGRKLADSAKLDGADGRARIAILTTLLRLRQICCHPSLVGMENIKQNNESFQSSKHLRLIEILNEAMSGNHKVLIFSQFQKQLLEIEKSIKLKEWDCLRLDGQTRNRQDLVNRFQADDGPPIFLISLKAGGYGLNLTAADIVVHMDPWWNPAAEDQATDRAHRIGQVNPVTVYRLLTRGTVEEAVLRMQRNKRVLAGAVDETGAGDAMGWTMDDLVSVLGKS